MNSSAMGARMMAHGESLHGKGPNARGI